MSDEMFHNPARCVIGLLVSKFDTTQVKFESRDKRWAEHSDHSGYPKFRIAHAIERVFG